MGAPAQELKLPELGENIDSVEVSAVLVAVGDDSVKRDQPVIEVETEKASLEVPAPSRRQDHRVVGFEGRSNQGGPGLCLRLEAAITEAVTVPEDGDCRRSSAPRTGRHSGRDFSRRNTNRRSVWPCPPRPPHVRSRANSGVDITEVPGHGSAAAGSTAKTSRPMSSRWCKRGVLAWRRARPMHGTPAAGLLAVGRDRARAADQHPPCHRGQRCPTHGTRCRTSLSSIRADITQLESMRKRFNQRPEAEGRKMTVTAILIKLVASALKQFPKLNSSLDLAGDAVVLQEIRARGCRRRHAEGVVGPGGP